MNLQNVIQLRGHLARQSFTAAFNLPGGWPLPASWRLWAGDWLAPTMPLSSRVFKRESHVTKL